MNDAVTPGWRGEAADPGLCCSTPLGSIADRLKFSIRMADNLCVNRKVIRHLILASRVGTLQPRATPRLAWRAINAPFDTSRFDEVFSQMGNIFEKQFFVAQGDVIK